MPGSDRVLIFETSSLQGQIALAEEGSVCSSAELGKSRRRASDLTQVVAQLLLEKNWKPGDLTAVVVGLGPGSYTGLRVGLASAKALAYALEIPFFGVETFAAIAARVPPGAARVSVIGDALQGKVYARSYALKGEALTPIDELRVQEEEVWRSTIEPGTVVTGPGLSLVSPLEGEVSLELRLPTPASLLQASKWDWATTTDMWTAEPFYLRGSSAEEKRKATV
jgi:tRNA threonylcarbamoyladenosine biosynthesis protein TsaB